jgi:hypothetical protein
VGEEWAYISFNIYVSHVKKFTSEINEEGEGLRKKRKIGFLFFVIFLHRFFQKKRPNVHHSRERVGTTKVRMAVYDIQSLDTLLSAAHASSIILFLEVAMTSGTSISRTGCALFSSTYRSTIFSKNESEKDT